MKCWEIKNCPFNGKNKKESKCPPHKNNCSCWEFDWIDFYNQMPDCEEKLEWRKTMLHNCKVCKVYKGHKSEMNKILNKLENA